MTSPIPHIGIEHHELDTALDRIELHYPKSSIYLVGTSFGGNYLLRYALRKKRETVKGLVALAPPLDVKQVIHDMPLIYQNFFTKRFIYENVTKHQEMQFW